MNEEQALFAAFVIPSKRKRYVELLGTKRGRSLAHFKDLDPRFCRKVAGQDSKPAAVLDALRKLGAPTKCHVISDDGELDGRGRAQGGTAMGRFASDIPHGVRVLPGRFTRWRKSHTGRLPIPDPLWAAAAEMAREHGYSERPKF